jgi:hypothetical protein
LAMPFLPFAVLFELPRVSVKNPYYVKGSNRLAAWKNADVIWIAHQ